jgi:hypothetical protein
MKGGIYKITNLITKDFYIGQSTNLESRKRSHWYKLSCNKHCNILLQSSWNKYGKENFRFEILLYCEPFEMVRYEQNLIDMLKPQFNMIPVIGSGYPFPKEVKDKMSESHLGKHFSEETIKKLRRLNLYPFPKIVTRDDKETLYRTGLYKHCAICSRIGFSYYGICKRCLKTHGKNEPWIKELRNLTINYEHIDKEIIDNFSHRNIFFSEIF